MVILTTIHRAIWESFEEEMKLWLEGCWDDLYQTKPHWFTDELVSLIPTDLIPNIDNMDVFAEYEMQAVEPGRASSRRGTKLSSRRGTMMGSFGKMVTGSRRRSAVRVGSQGSFGKLTTAMQGGGGSPQKTGTQPSFGKWKTQAARQIDARRGSGRRGSVELFGNAILGMLGEKDKMAITEADEE